MLSDLRYRLRRMLTHAAALLPSFCALCGAAGNDAICGACHARFFAVRRPRCRQCALPLSAPMAAPADDAATCGACLRDPPGFDAAIAAADYAPPLDQLVLALKFGGRLALAPLLARTLRDAVLDVQHHAHGLPMRLTAVPLGARRLAERGFNQAHEIARPLSRALGIALAPRLAVRERETEAQSLLHPDARQENMRGAFAVPETMLAQVEGAHIGIVDDVMTTGQTLNELARTLKRAGAARVTALVFARTLPK
ncbi:MAG TPA: ComF family protein [Paucimonas sp.]|nr:ComF family protein [Paucimonas sp.]